MTHVEDVNTMIQLRAYLEDIADNTQSSGLHEFYSHLAYKVKEELRDRGINRTTLMRVKT